MLIRIEIFAVVLLLLLALGGYTIYVQKKSAVALSVIEQQKKTIEEKDRTAKNTAAVLSATIHDREVMRDELQSKITKLKKLQLTDSMRKCNDQPLPAGYAQRMLHSDNKHASGH